MKRKFGQPTLPTLYFRDGILSVPGYTFERAVPWEDTGSLTIIAEGNSLKDGSNVLAKIAPAQTNGSMCLEREAHILARMAESARASNAALRMIDFFNIPPVNGDCVVLLLMHPGLNTLGRYLPPFKVNHILLADGSRLRRQSSYTDIDMVGVEEDETEAFDVMDLATFLEFAIQATHCLEVMHKCGFVHREVRANAFHLSSHSGRVRFVHFGNRAVSLESYGSPSSLVFKAYGESEKLKVKDALCYLAPEQTSSTETVVEDHRTDLYSLGVLFWTLLVGRGQKPFEGGPLELLHAIVQRRPMPVHEVRRDVPQVLAEIVDKLISKHPDSRYQSAYGLKADLLECQSKLLATVASSSDQSSELIAPFEIALQDHFMEFTLPISLFGRERELDIIRNVIQRQTSDSFSRHCSATKGFITISSSGSQDTGTGEDHSDSMSSLSEVSHKVDGSKPGMTRASPVYENNSSTMSANSSLSPSENFRRAAFSTSQRSQRTQAVFVVGPPGAGKSSLILVNQAKWRTHGLWGQAKFQGLDSAPFEALLECLSSVLRQLMVFHTDIPRFVQTLKDRLGPQLQNIPLLYHGTPELKDILDMYGVTVDTPLETLSSAESRARFKSLVEAVFSIISETRLFALFLDDLHEADESTLDLVATLIHSRSRMLIFATLRSDKPEIVEQFRSMFTNWSRHTWINVENLNYSSIAALVSRTLHRSREECATLSHFVFAASGGNAFSARSILTSLHRQHHITFDWDNNHWVYNMDAIQGSTGIHPTVPNPCDLSFLTSQFEELPEEARKYLIWATFIGSTFKITQVALMMDWDDSGDSGNDEEEMNRFHQVISTIRDNTSNTRTSTRGLQIAIAEGWLTRRARDMCSFSHDRYWQATRTEVEKLPEKVIARMSFRIVLLLLHESPMDPFRVAEHTKKCIKLLREHTKREDFLRVLMDAGELAVNLGAHELALQSFSNAQRLLHDDNWCEKPERTFILFSKIASLYTWKGDYVKSNAIIQECLIHAEKPQDRSSLLRMRSTNHFMSSNLAEALSDTLSALNCLGIQVNHSPSRREADVMFEEVKNEILAVGFEDIIQLPESKDPRVELTIALLNDAGMHAYWSPSRLAFVDVLGLTSIKVALRCGMTPGTALGFFWVLEAAAERRELYRFSCDLAKLALRIADKFGNNMEKCRALLLFCAMVSGFDSVHVRANLPRLREAIKFGNAAGDAVYTSLSSIHVIQTRLFICDHLSDLLPAAEECLSDVTVWQPKGEFLILATSLLNCIRALGGFTDAKSAGTLFDTDNFKESEYVNHIAATSGNVPLAMNWYNSFKVVALFCLGFVEEAAELGTSIYQSRDLHPNHRHVRYGLFFHNLALIACIRKGKLSKETKLVYFKQVDLNQAFIRKWLSPSPTNTSTWVAIVDAEVASIHNKPTALRLYDIAVKLAVNNDWPMEEGWALYLQGCHFIRCGVEGLGGELQRRGISRQRQWGAKGIADQLSQSMGSRPRYPLKRPIFCTDVAVQTEQTESVILGYDKDDHEDSGELVADVPEEMQLSQLTASNLAMVLSWSKDISSDIDLSSALQKLTEIATETSGSQNTCLVISRESGGDYIIATSMFPPEPCQVHENPKPIGMLTNPLQKTIIHHVLNSKERLFLHDSSADSRFSSDAGQTALRAVICLPIFGNRGQTFGALYISSKYPFSQTIFLMISLLCQQASFSIANALLFRSVQAGTKENLKVLFSNQDLLPDYLNAAPQMITAQKNALESARRSREDALKATKIKSNFLASMSHELRTPFSSFYGLLDLLSGTELNAGQSDIVQTAKQSCELLLRIIDSILDYSKLEASALKLEFTGFSVENIIADCMELLLPMAAIKLDLSFNIEPDVPQWVFSDSARIRQVLMNLMGNAVKFTEHGYVRVLCSLESCGPTPGEVQLKFVIQDTGIGLSPSDIDLLFTPFQQADNSSTRRFGGTGLGLSISRQLVQLMGGAIGVQSELSVGSIFWFTLPIKIFSSEESKKSSMAIDMLRSMLQQPRPPQLLICSPSEATSGLLKTMLKGFSLVSVSSIHDAETFLHSMTGSDPSLDFIILDDQSEAHADDMAASLKVMQIPALQETHVIHLYTPTTRMHSGGQNSMFKSNTQGVVRMTKPPRTVRLLRLLADVKKLPSVVPQLGPEPVVKPIEDPSTSQRTLYGNILVAEDNPVARQLLIKQLERYQLHVTATTNGAEALQEWSSHDPGYFTLAMFDHHMPVCDGVEAAKRLRILETEMNSPVSLPIVALSADCQQSTMQLCLSAGMNAFFSKPLKKSDLTQLLSMFGPSQSSKSMP